MKIQWKKGYRGSGDARKCYRSLEKIRARDGHIEAAAIVAAAQARNSPLHREFQWDDTKAATDHRLEQARLLTRSIQVVYAEMPEIPIRAYETVTIAPSQGKPVRKVYQSIEEIIKDPVMRDELLGRAINDAISFRRKYNALSEFSQVFAAIDVLMVHAGI